MIIADNNILNHNNKNNPIIKNINYQFITVLALQSIQQQIIIFNILNMNQITAYFFKSQ